MFERFRHVLELIRFSHTVFALPFALLSGLMAWTYRTELNGAAAWRWREALGILLCMIFGRSVAMAFNRIADREIDANNPRTKARHLPAGVLKLNIVAAFAWACAAGFVFSTLLFLPENRWPLYLSAPVLLFLCGYSFAKRFTWLAHFWLGAALMLAPVCAWIALVGFTNIIPAVLLGAAVLLWVAGFDVIYACQDVDADLAQGLFSIPARFGVPAALRIAAFCHLGAIIVLYSLPTTFPALGWIYYTGVTIIALLLLYEHWLVRPDDLTRVNVAFFHINAVISIGLLAVGAVDLLMRS